MCSCLDHLCDKNGFGLWSMHHSETERIPQTDEQPIGAASLEQASSHLPVREEQVVGTESESEMRTCSP